MNLQQIKYIIAVDNCKNFARAADKCFVTQPTLSMMIKKLETELGIKIFDRGKKPVLTTKIGSRIVAQAKKILAESARLKEIIHEETGEISGELKIGIIPTLAPYLLPLFLNAFAQKNPGVRLSIAEHITPDIINRLTSGELDLGILATPLNDERIIEHNLFYEKFYLYVSKSYDMKGKSWIVPADLNLNELWLLEEGHCMRSQVLNLCELKKMKEVNNSLNYEAGSIETLKNIVDKNRGMTIIPELAAAGFSAADKKKLIPFKSPAPVREISVVNDRSFVRAKLAGMLKKSILDVIPRHMKNPVKKMVVGI